MSGKVNTDRKLILFIISVIAGTAVAVMPPPAGLERNAMIVLGLLLWAIINWVGTTMPDFVTALIMCCMWAVLGVIPVESALAGFSNTSVWLLVGALGFGAAITKSGLLARAALLVMKICPSNFTGQVLAQLIAGTVIGPFIPSTSAKVSVAGVMSTEIGKQLGFKSRSKGMSGITAAMYTGFTLNAPIFLSSSFFAYFLIGLLPAEEQAEFTFNRWFISMLPWGIFILVMSFLAINIMFAPKEKTCVSKEEIEKKIKEKGPMNKNEKITLGMLVLCGFLLVMERRIGISSTITFIFVMAVLIALKVISTKDYNTGIAWSLFTFAGVVVNLGTVLSTVGVDTWISDTFGIYMASLTGNPYLFVLVVSIAVILVRFLIVSYFTTFTLFVVILSPFCIDAGISPWIVAICTYVCCQPFFAKYQNVNYLTAFTAAGGDEVIDHNHMALYSLVFHVIAIIGLIISVPYWKMLGIIA